MDAAPLERHYGGLHTKPNHGVQISMKSPPKQGGEGSRGKNETMNK